MALTREQFQELRNKGLSVQQIVNFESGDIPETQKEDVKYTTRQKLGQLLTGAGKGTLKTIKGLSTLGEKVLQAPLKAAGVEFDDKSSAEKLQKTAESKLGLEEGELTKAKTPFEKAGMFVEQVAEFAIPATKVSKLTKGASFVEKLAARAVTSGGVATAQEGKVGKGTGIAAGVEIALPTAGKVLKPVAGIVSRLFKGLGSSLSGVPTEALEKIASNPQTAREISRQIVKEGQESILENNAKTIMNGVANIRKSARSAYGKGLEKLSQVDIKPSTIKNNLISRLENNGIKIKNGSFDFTNSEILDEKIITRAKNLVNDINKSTKASGKEIRTLIEKIDSSKFKSALNPDRQAFNNLANDLSSGLRKAISESTNKLDKINKNYSQVMDLADSVQKIFGKVNFKNTSELNAIAKKLETLFSQKGLDAKTVDNFLTKIGVDPADFRTSEAVRGIANKTTGANTKGLTITEVIQQLTSSIITPNTVKDISIATGLGENFLKILVEKVSPEVRALIIESLLSSTEE